MRYDRCPNCMKALEGDVDKCPYCEFEIANYKERPTCLRPFTVLQNKYMIGRVIGVGGFGITYIGWDMNLQTYIAIKEYYPESFVTRDTQGENGTVFVVPKEANKNDYEKGLKRYVEEAQNLSKFYNLPGVVSVKDFFYENGTAYIVMEYINGINLKEYLNSIGGGKLPEATVLSLMKPVFESLFTVHNGGLVHRDISPDNIMVTTDGKIKVIDFGSARENDGSADKTFTVILKHGYAPPEQYYAKGNQGPWTDIYSLCAAMYKMLSGEVPPNSIERMENDEYVAPSAHGVSVSPRTEYVLQRGLAVKTSERYQDIGQLLNDLYGSQPIVQNQMTPTPIASVSAPTAVTQQSMYLNEPIQKKKSNKGLVIGILSGVVLAILAVVLVLVLGKEDDDTKPTLTATTTTTEEATSTTTDATTETPGPDIPDIPGYVWVWPTELSDKWQDYTFNINDTIYQLPMPYSEFMNKGWRSDYIPQSIAAGDTEYMTVYLNGLEASVVVVNYSMVATTVENCYLIAFSIDQSYQNVPKDTVFELAGGVRLGESSLQQVKSAFGAPDAVYEGDVEEYPEGHVTIDYAGDTWEDGMDLVFDADVLSAVSLGNTAVPDGFELDPSQIEVVPPEINAQYEAPASASTERFDSIITVGEKHYQLPAPVSEFTEDGWTLDSATDDYILGDSCVYTYLQKDGNKISVTLENYTENAILPINAFVSEITVESSFCDFDIVFPGDIRLGDTGSKIDEVYSDVEDYTRDDEWGSFVSYHVFYYPDDDNISYISVSGYSDTDTDIITDYTYAVQIRRY